MTHKRKNIDLSASIPGGAKDIAGLLPNGSFYTFLTSKNFESPDGMILVRTQQFDATAILSFNDKIVIINKYKEIFSMQRDKISSINIDLTNKYTAESIHALLSSKSQKHQCK